MAKKAATKKPAAKRPAKGGKFVRSKLAGSAGTKRAGAMGERADKGADASVAIERMAAPQRAIARAAAAMIRREVPGTTGVVKWGNPVYQTAGKSFCALMETKAGVNLALPGMKLADPEKLLEGTGGLMRHVKLRDIAMVKLPAVAALVRGAAVIGLPRM